MSVSTVLYPLILLQFIKPCGFDFTVSFRGKKKVWSIMNCAVYGALEHGWEQDDDSAGSRRTHCFLGILNCNRFGCLGQSWQVSQALEITWYHHQYRTRFYQFVSFFIFFGNLCNIAILVIYLLGLFTSKISAAPSRTLLYFILFFAVSGELVRNSAGLIEVSVHSA